MTVPRPEGERKAELRGQIRARRRLRTDDERASVASALAIRLGSVPEIAALVAEPHHGVVAAYASYAAEPGTTTLRELLALSGVRVLLPVIAEDGGLDWAWDVGELAATSLSRGIPEPPGDVVGHGADGLHALECRVLLVPALAVDRHGHRLGKGGGYYDRLLDALVAHPGRAPLICAVVHDDEVLDDVPVEAFDRPVEAALTPDGFTRLR